MPSSIDHPHDRPTVAQVIGRFGGGGAERLAINLALAMKQAGARSIAIGLRDASGYASTDGYDVEVVDLGLIGAGTWATVRAMMRLRRMIRKRRIDLVHVHGRYTLPFVAIAMWGLSRRHRVWFTWHDSENVLADSGWRGRLMRWALGRCERIFGSSRSVADRLRGALSDRPAIASRVSVFRNGVPQTPQSPAVDAEAPTLLWLGRIVPPKDPQIVIRAAARLRDDGLDFRVVLAGDAPPALAAFRDETRRLIDDLNLGDRVSMPGWIDDTPAAIGAASIGVQTSHTEGLSMTLLEQMMAGMAIVATDVGDTSAAIDDGQTGLLIPPEDPARLHEALATLIADRTERARLGAAARRRAIAEFSLAAMARNVLHMLDSPVGAAQSVAANRQS